MTDDYAAVCRNIPQPGGTALNETCRVREDGVTLHYEGDGEIAALLHAYADDAITVHITIEKE